MVSFCFLSFISSNLLKYRNWNQKITKNKKRMILMKLRNMMKIEILMKLIKIKNLIMIMMKLKTLIKMQKK